jgi:hypothetical protein
MRRPSALLAYPLMVTLLMVTAASCSQSSVDIGSSVLQGGVDLGVEIALGLIKDQAAAQADAKIAQGIIEGTILPLLKGGGVNLTAQIQQLLTLGHFQPGIVQQVLSSVLPLLMNALTKIGVIPADLMSNPAAKINPQVIEYLTAFFQGADDGITAYLNGTGSKQVMALRALK